MQGLSVNQASNSEINKTLALIYAMIGLRTQHLPTPQDDILLFRFLREEYGAKTLDELYLAFKLSIKGELDIEDAKVYDQFTCEYVARIMTGYRKWVKTVSSNITPEPPKMILNNFVTSPEEKAAEIAEWEAKEDIRLDFIPPYIFDYLKEAGKISVSDEVRNEYMAKARDMVKGELYNEYQSELLRKIIGAGLNYKKFMIMLDEKRWSAEYISRFRNLAKKIIVFEYLNSLKK